MRSQTGLAATIVCCALLAPGPGLRAQEPQELPLERLLTRVQARYRALGDMHASFRQRQIARPGMPAVEDRGGLYTRAPGLLRMEYEDSGRVFVADGETIYWYLPDDNQVQLFSQDTAASTRAGVLYLASGGDLRNDFLISGAQYETPLRAGNVQLRLQPLQPNNNYAYLILEVDPDTALVARLIQFGVLGEVMELVLEHIETELTLDDAVFRFEIPPGTQVETLGN